MTASSPAKPPSAYKAAPRTFVSSAPLCPRCDKSVYAAEQVLGPGGREYHKPCLTCISCKKTVQPGGFHEHEGDPYCKHCYAKHHGPKGLGFGGSMTGEYTDPILSRSPFSSPARGGSLPSNRNSGAYSDRFAGASDSPSKGSIGSSTRGGGSPAPNLPSRSSIESPVGMYRTSRLQEMEDASQSMSVDGDDDDAAEEERNRTLGRGNDSPSGEQGNGRNGHSGVNVSQLEEAPDFDGEPARGASVSPTKPGPPSAATSSYRGSPLKHALPPTDHHSFGGRPASPASSIGTSAASSSGNTAESGTGGGVRYNSNLGLLQSSGPALCRRCQTPVYHAEQIVASGHKWHKRCLRCATCGKALDSHLQEKDNLPYCKRCYDDQWGLKSQGFVLRPGLH